MSLERIQQLALYKFYKSLIKRMASVKKITVEEVEDFMDSEEFKLFQQRDREIKNIRQYLKKNYPKYEGVVCNALGRYFNFNTDDNTYTKDDFRYLLYESDIHVAGIGDVYREALRDYFYEK